MCNNFDTPGFTFLQNVLDIDANGSLENIIQTMMSKVDAINAILVPALISLLSS